MGTQSLAGSPHYTLPTLPPSLHSPYNTMAGITKESPGNSLLLTGSLTTALLSLLLPGNSLTTNCIAIHSWTLFLHCTFCFIGCDLYKVSRHLLFSLLQTTKAALNSALDTVVEPCCGIEGGDWFNPMVSP